MYDVLDRCVFTGILHSSFHFIIVTCQAINKLCGRLYTLIKRCQLGVKLDCRFILLLKLLLSCILELCLLRIKVIQAFFDLVKITGLEWSPACRAPFLFEQVYLLCQLSDILGYCLLIGIKLPYLILNFIILLVYSIILGVILSNLLVLSVNLFKIRLYLLGIFR